MLFHLIKCLSVLWWSVIEMFDSNWVGLTHHGYWSSVYSFYCLKPENLPPFRYNSGAGTSGRRQLTHFSTSGWSVREDCLNAIGNVYIGRWGFAPHTEQIVTPNGSSTLPSLPEWYADTKLRILACVYHMWTVCLEDWPEYSSVGGLGSSTNRRLFASTIGPVQRQNKHWKSMWSSLPHSVFKLWRGLHWWSWTTIHQTF